VQLPDWVPRSAIKNWSVQDASHNFDNMHSYRARSCVRVNNVRKVIAFRSHPQPEATTRSPPAILARARMRRALRPPLWDTALLGSEVGNSPREPRPRPPKSVRVDGPRGRCPFGVSCRISLPRRVNILKAVSLPAAVECYLCARSDLKSGPTSR
jgi:hypothetical protein